MTNTTEERLFKILNDELTASCVGNGVTECTWTVLGKAKAVELIQSEIEAAEKAKVEEVIEEIELLGKLNAAVMQKESIFSDLASHLRIKFLNKPDDESNN